MKNLQNGRRQFIATVLKSMAALPIGWAVLSQTALAKKVEGKLVDLNDPVAKALKYTHDASKSPDRKVEKQGVKADKQLCNNCTFYTKQGELGGAEVGKCTLIPTGFVKAQGWCASWSKKM